MPIRITHSAASVRGWIKDISGGGYSQQQLLTGTGNDFASSISASNDGTYFIIGADGETIGSNVNQGSAYIYIKVNGIYTQQQKLTASDGAANNNFGYSVSMSGDGTTVVVGTLNNCCYVFIRSGTTWTQSQKLTASDGAAGDSFGQSVSISNDGNSIIIGALFDDVSFSDQGSAYIFTKSGSLYSEYQKLIASDGRASDRFGNSVDINSNGTKAIIGAYLDNIGVIVDQGSSYVFTLSGSVWSESQKLTASDGAANNDFGQSVSMSNDGNTIVIGANGFNSDQGCSYIFAFNGTTYIQEQKLLADDGSTGDNFGFSVSIDGSGNKVLIGAYLDTVAGNTRQGSSYLFNRSGGVWTQSQKLVANDGVTDDRFGTEVTLSNDSSTLGICASLGNKAYIFTGN